MGHSALSFFKPSKNQGNAPILVGDRRIDSETISEVPTDAQIEGADVPEIARPYKDVTIELHAQDMDRSKFGWAGVVPEISGRRLRMELEPPIKPEQVYMKDKVRGDIMLVLKKRADGTYQPSAIHLLDLKERE